MSECGVAYSGAERRKETPVVHMHCSQEAVIAAMKAELDASKAVAERTYDLVKDIQNKTDEFHKRMLEGNGHPAVIPDLDRRLGLLERDAVPHDDVKEVVESYKTGKFILISIVIVALIGFLGTAFWHFFKPVAAAPALVPGVIPK